MPDEGSFLDHIPGDWTGGKVRDHFSNSLPMVVWWSLSASMIPKKLRGTFETASPRDLRRIQHQLSKDHDGVAPNLLNLATALVS